MRNSLLGFLCLMLTIVACEKPESKIGLELLPSEEYLGFGVDSSTVLLQQVRQDSLRTDQLSSAILGDFYDPIVGHTSTKIYTQLRLSNTNVNFSDSANIDSLVLILTYAGEHYGALEDFQISVKRITDTLEIDSSYYSYNQLAVDEQELVDPSFNIITPAPEDSVVVGGDTLVPQMRIRLDNAWATENLLQTDVSNFESNENFLEHLHGFRISATTQGLEGGLVYMNLYTSVSKMTLYYNLGGDDDSLSYDFAINSINSSASQNYVQFEHTYDPLIESNIGGGFEMDGEVIIHSTAGLGVEVLLPNIYDFADEGENIVINNAVLELPVVDAPVDLETYAPHDEIKAVRLFEGAEVNIPDATLSTSGTDYVGGIYDEDNNVYRVTVTRFIQQVLNGQIEEPIFTLYPTLSRTVGNRTRIKVGSVDEDRRTKLIINYTTF